MKKEVYAILLGYFKSQTTEIYKLLEKIKNTKPADIEKSVYLAYSLHNLYCAFEDLFKEVAKTFENQISDLSKYHRELLKRMSFDIPGIRPMLLSEASYTVLDELRSFRHVFRHSYTYNIESEKVKYLKNKILVAWNEIEKDLNNFKEFLEDKLI